MIFLQRIIENLLNGEDSWYTWKGFLKYSLYIFIAVLVFDLIFGSLISKIVKPNQFLKVALFLLSFLPSYLYILIFLINRLWIRATFSRKTNIIIAYNLENLINPKKFQKKYDSFIRTLKNEVNRYNLGDIVRIIPCPPDIKLKNDSIAEAKTRLGLEKCSTLLVWGYVYKNKGKIQFRTKFSYEFGYPSYIKEYDAKKRFQKKTGNVFGTRLFGLDNLRTQIDGNIFSDHILQACLYLLGITTFSTGFLDKSLIFFNSFVESYRQANLLRKKEMSPILIDVEKYIVSINKYDLFKLIKAFQVDPLKKYMDEIKSTCLRILEIDKRDYDSYLALAYIHAETDSTLDKAKEFNNLAEGISPKNKYEHIFNKAFFSLCAGDFKESLDVYNSIPDLIYTDTESIQEYLSRYSEKTKNPAFDFADGYIAYRWGDEKLSKKIMRRFIKKCRNDRNFNPLIFEAEKILSTY